MAVITPNEKNGKIVSYKFKACMGRNKDGKQILSAAHGKCLMACPHQRWTRLQ